MTTLIVVLPKNTTNSSAAPEKI